MTRQRLQPELKNKWISENQDKWKSYYQKWYKKNKKNHIKNVMIYNIIHPSIVSKSNKKYWSTVSKEKKKEYNKKHTKQWMKKYHSDKKFRKAMIERSQRYYQRNRKKIIKRVKRWYKNKASQNSPSVVTKL